MNKVKNNILNAFKFFLDNLKLIFVSKTDVVNDLTSTSTEKPLSANQGRILKDSIDEIKTNTSSIDIPITLTSSGWTGTAAPYSQTLTVPQMREGMTPLFFLASEGDDAQYAFSLITGYKTGYAEIIFYAADKPTVDLDLILKGIPAQELKYVDNTVVFLVEPSAFTQNAATHRYEATITVEGMTAGTGGTWDIVRSGPVLTEAESRITLSITDVDRQDGAVKITCLEVPEQRYMMSISGAYPDAEPGTVILANMQEWFDRVDNLDSATKTFTILEQGTYNVNTEYTPSNDPRKCNYFSGQLEWNFAPVVKKMWRNSEHWSATITAFYLNGSVFRVVKTVMMINNATGNVKFIEAFKAELSSSGTSFTELDSISGVTIYGKIS